MSSLVTTLQKSIKVYDDTNPKWHQFMLDHKDYLISQSQINTITPDAMQRYVFNPKRYLRAINYEPSCMWIVLLVNSMNSELDFTADTTILYMPPFATIELLYTTFLASQQTH